MLELIWPSGLPTAGTDLPLRLAWPLALAALPLPLLTMLLPRARRRPGAALRVPAPFLQALVADAGGGRRAGARRAWLWLAVPAWLLLCLAAARPQWVGEPTNLPASGRDLLLAIDISASMDTVDMVLDGLQSNRLQVVQAIAGDFIERRRGDRLGLVLFGGRAYLQSPLTFDRNAVRTFLDEAETKLAGRETAIGDAIGLAAKRLEQMDEEDPDGAATGAKQRVLILLTDGANNAGVLAPLQAADIAAQLGLRIYTIGVGADEILRRDVFGIPRARRATDLDENTLRAIARTTGGRYFRARDSAELEAIYGLLDELEPVQGEEQTYRPVGELYPWPLALALALSALPGLAVLARSRPGQARPAAG